VLDARHSNTFPFGFSGESVNCGSDQFADNDIHIALVETADEESENDSLTAEISPHFRPAAWDRFDVNPKTSQIANGLPLKGRQVRLTGQLFFDGSHHPCKVGQCGPARFTVWEIHPIYAIEVKDGSKWVSLEEFANNH
jgi:hypothetical protein